MENLYDAIIVGGGPAGLSAAIYMARARFHVLVIEKEKFGGQITITTEVVNYPGIPKTTGADLTANMERQAKSFGAEFLNAEVTDLELDGDYKIVKTDHGEFKTLGVIYAGGAHPRLAGFAGEQKFRGHGVAYCATCDGEFFTDRTIFVVGGGFAAVEEGLFLTKYAKNLIVVVRGDDFTISSAAVDELKENPKVKVLFNTQIENIEGQHSIQKVTLKNRKTGEETDYEAEDGDFFGVFVFVGYAPENKLLLGKVNLDPRGYVITDENQKTNIDGVYAAGDICVKNLRQVVTAVSDGAVAATALEKYLGEQYRKLELKRVYHSRKAEKKEPVQPAEEAGSFLDADTKTALRSVLEKFDKPIILRLYSDGGNLSRENEGLLKDISGLSDKITYEVVPAAEENNHTIYILDQAGKDLGLHFHGVPGGHEFNSFVLAMYNAAGPGQDVGESREARIHEIKEEKHIKIAVSLSCVMCPDLVAAAQRIAAGNDLVTVDVYDLAHYPEMQKQYNIMSVPCMIINDDDVHFGKKNIAELLDILHV